MSRLRCLSKPSVSTPLFVSEYESISLDELQFAHFSLVDFDIASHQQFLHDRLFFLPFRRSLLPEKNEMEFLGFVR